MNKKLIPFFSPHKPVGSSETIPDQAFTVSDILAKFVGGQMLDGLLKDDELGDDVDETIDDDFDSPRQGDPGDFDRHVAMDYVGNIYDEIAAFEELARHNLDNDVLDDTTKKNKKSGDDVADVKN